MASVWVKRGIILASSALLIGGATLGVSYAQGTPSGPPAPGPRMEMMHQLMDKVAANLGITTDRLQEAFRSAHDELGLPDRPPGAMGRHHWRGGRDSGPGEFRRPGGDGEFRGPMAPGAFRGQDGELRGPMAGLDTVTSTLGITPQQLMQELPGKSLADVARAHNVDPSVLATALKAQADSRIDQMINTPMPERPERG